MPLSDETKHKLMKAAPWVIGAGVLIFLYLKLKSGGSQVGSAPVQNLSALGGGNPAPVVSGPQQVPGDVAQQIASTWQNRRDAVLGMRQQWDSYFAAGGQAPGAASGPYGSGVVSKAWQQIAGGNWEDIYHPGHIITEQQAEALSSQNSGPYAKGSGGFFGQIGGFLGNALSAVTSSWITKGANMALPSGAPSIPYPSYTPPLRQVPSGNGSQAPVPGPAMPGYPGYGSRF